MSNLATTAPGELVVTPEVLRDWIKYPLRMLPADWRTPVWDFWASWSHLIESQLALANRLRGWIKADGLTLDEALDAFAQVNDPARSSEIRFKGDLLAEIAKVVAKTVAKRKSLEAQEERRRQADRDAAGVSRRNLTAGIGTGGKP